MSKNVPFKKILPKEWRPVSDAKSENPAVYTILKKRKKRRSKYDVVNIFGNHSGKKTPYLENLLEERKFNAMIGIETLTTDPTLNLRRQQDRTVFTDKQMFILETAYQKDKHPDPKRREMVAELCDLSAERVRIWYQNRRAKEKRNEIDELAALAKRFCNPEGSAQRSSTYHSIASINRRISRIFDDSHDDQNTDEEDVIKKIMQKELLGSSTHSQDNDRQKTGLTSDEQERELVRQYLRNARSRNVKTSKNYEDLSSIPENKTYKRKRRRDEHIHLNSTKLCSNIRVPHNEINNSNNVQEEISSNHFNSEDKDFNPPFPSNMPLDIASLDRMSESQQLYLLHLMNQRQALLNYHNLVNKINDKEKETDDHHYTCITTNSNEVELKTNSTPAGTQPFNWMNYLQTDEMKLPSISEIFHHQLTAEGSVDKRYMISTQQANEAIKKSKSVSEIHGLKKYTQQDAMHYEFIRKSYENDLNYIKK